MTIETAEKGPKPETGIEKKREFISGGGESQYNVKPK
jgi:hypothetical protein|tara:strand:- start:157 stop:267 length:111 start_codon:yes stop_codon:yes gene_type:complete